MDCIKQLVDSPTAIISSQQNLSYVIAYEHGIQNKCFCNNKIEDYVKDVTKRYSSQWRDTERNRADENWYQIQLNQLYNIVRIFETLCYFEKSHQRGAEWIKNETQEASQFREIEIDQIKDFPKNQAGFRNHPM